MEMKLYTLRRMLVVAVSALVLLGVGIPSQAHQQAQDQQDKKKDKKQKQEKQQKAQEPTTEAGQQGQRGRRQHQQEAGQRGQRAQAQLQQQAAEQEQQPAQQQERRTTANGERVSQSQQEQRLARQRQQQLNSEQQQRLVLYRQQVQSQDRLWTQRSALLQQQRRTAQYRFQQQYLERRRQQILEQNSRSYDYNNDPNFYAAPNYRYSRAGRSYQTNQYGADLLRQAVNYGYDEGFQAGQADQQDRWRGANYQSSYAYQDANYGYSGYYVAQAEYSYYFREGFRRGYEDGLNTRSQYGNYSNGNHSILSQVLSQILNLSQF
jgi:hypothetical protein